MLRMKMFAKEHTCSGGCTLQRQMWISTQTVHLSFGFKVVRDLAQRDMEI